MVVIDLQEVVVIGGQDYVLSQADALTKNQQHSLAKYPQNQPCLKEFEQILKGLEIISLTEKVRQLSYMNLTKHIISFYLNPILNPILNANIVQFD